MMDFPYSLRDSEILYQQAHYEKNSGCSSGTFFAQWDSLSEELGLVTNNALVDFPNVEKTK
jgi:hypothetical protein